MRIKTSSIPADQLKKVILNAAARQGKDAAETRLELVRLLSLSARYSEAAAELKTIIKDFPDLDKENHERLLQAYVQQYIDLILQEIARLRRGGQHKQAQFLLSGLDNTAAGTESLIQASEMLAGYEKSTGQKKRVLESLEPLVKTSKGEAPRLKMISLLFDEIKADLNYNNLPRMADFLNLVDGAGLQDEEKLAIGISGWLLGQGEVIRNLNVAASLLEVRNLVREYLRAMGPDKRAVREELISRIKDREGGTPEYVTKLLLNMKPPMDMPQPTEVEGMFEVAVPGSHPDFPVNYTVQLPPEYDPYVRYPVVLSLHATGGNSADQLTWWAGDYDEQKRRRIGQATRHGYIVIAPKWTEPKQRRYLYSTREHDVVLKSLRDATRRFSIDTDRVFISGHATGGDAAWDMALAHPDLWAGMILIGARGDYGPSAPGYVTFYADNAKYFPMYQVFGELDGDKWHENSIHINRYMRPGYDPVIVQYQGRGNEHFYEEIQTIFEWMELQQRRPTPKKIEVSSMRPSDYFFWFAEFTGLPAKTMVSEYAWPVDKPNAANIEASIGSTNTIRVKSGAARTTVWLSPEIVDFSKRIQISIDGKKLRGDYIPSLEVILEDARRRADRQHVFWAKATNR
jgi:pimeloyl-ACP methyl ester carboxylesterase